MEMAQELLYPVAANLVGDYVRRQEEQIRLQLGAEHHPLILILRGVFGCGKTTFASEVFYHARANDLTFQICQADSQFEDEDVEDEEGSNWDPNELEIAFAMCKYNYVVTLAGFTDVIVVDNTHVSRSNIDTYEVEGRKVTGDIYVIEFDCVNEEMAETFRQRSTRHISAQRARGYFRCYADNRLPPDYNNLIVLPPDQLLH